jgi:hypothetical protein
MAQWKSYLRFHALDVAAPAQLIALKFHQIGGMRAAAACYVVPLRRKQNAMPPSGFGDDNGTALASIEHLPEPVFSLGSGNLHGALFGWMMALAMMAVLTVSFCEQVLAAESSKQPSRGAVQ